VIGDLHLNRLDRIFPNGTGAGGVLSTRRGAEKGLFIVTIILATLFMSVALAQLFL
jgi:preprotein translocase subunit SecG